MGMILRGSRCSRPIMKKGVDAPRGFAADTLDLHEVRQRSPFDRLKRTEMQKQRALAGRSDAGNLLQARLAQVALAARAVRTDGKAVRLVAQTFNEIKHWIARRQPERVAPWNKERFPPGIALGPFGDGSDRNRKTESGQNFACGRELALPAIDQHEVGPGRFVLRIENRVLFPSPL